MDRCYTCRLNCLAAWLLAAALIVQVASACKNCVVLSKAEKALFRIHGESCATEVQSSQLLTSLMGGDAQDSPLLRRLVYCVLRRGKVITKDGKIIKSPTVDKLARGQTRKAADSCGPQSTPAPEDVAWRLLRCGYAVDT